MKDDMQLEAMRAEIIAYYHGESARLERQSMELYRLAGQCRVWAENIHCLPEAGVEYVYGVVEKAKADQAESMASQLLSFVKAEAARQQ
ncbi:MAG: hypothetical protein HY795_18810 [Desulfovibrio sp.]|nr:hypothetical protein [Desulfovibrio sp.]MBI4960941.1 hypothetical protein [Desulfovibrio sp.]